MAEKSKKSDPQCRKYQITINNPEQHNLTRDIIIEKLLLFMPIYFCLSKEVGENGTPHIHIYLESGSAIRWSTVKSRFPSAHIEKALGSARQNRDYIKKEGAFENTVKAETSIPGSFYEWGTLPESKSDNSTIFSTVLNEVKDGKSINDIIDNNPSLIFKINDLTVLQETIKSQIGNIPRTNMFVTYIYGPSGSGKSSYIFKQHDANDICRITTYRKNGVIFDNYNGQPVLVFEEYHSQIDVTSLLNYLDIHPLTLPARYRDRVALYTIVYIISNIPLSDQYKNIQKDKPEVWNAVLRRIHRILKIEMGGIVIEEYNCKKEKKNGETKD